MRFLRPAAVDCRHAVELIARYLDADTGRVGAAEEGPLSRGDRRRLESHLADCPLCTEYLHQMRATISASQRAGSEQPSAETAEALAQMYRDWRERR